MRKEFLLAMQEALAELLTEAEAKSSTEPECDCTNNSCHDLQSGELVLTPIEDCITAFINKCTAEDRVPTLEEAKSIYILDYINSKYN